MAGQICLKWNSFLNNIATSFEHLWEEEGLVDVTLASDGQCLTAHKVILSASSPFFKKVFQTNPCRHPVIILQDIHFTELEALLIFIYKGEVNIEEDKLPALLKAAETLQIRGLTGNDAVPKSSPKEFVKPERSSTESSPSTTNEEQPRRKKQKIHKTLRDSTPEAAPTLRVTRSSSVNEIVNVEKRDDGDESAVDRDPLEMKIEPLDIATEDFDKQDQEVLNTDRLEPENPLGVQGPSSRPTIRVIAEATNRDKSPQRSHDDHEVHQEKIIILESKETVESDNDDPSSDYRPSSSSSIDGPSEDSRDNVEVVRETVKEPSVYPPFPCPFCDKAYTSWGFRRRHIKAVHTTSPSLHCKWCSVFLPSHAEWKRHVISLHSLSPEDAQNGLLIFEEAHMVLQSADPTKVSDLHNTILQNSKFFPDYRK